MTLKIYYAPNTRAVRIVWMMEELGLPYQLEHYKLGDKAMRTDEFRAIHPLGRVPVVDDGEVRLFESGAIIQYILEKYGDGRLRPTSDSAEFPTYLQWLHYAEGMIMPPVNTIVVETILLPEERRTPHIAARAQKLLGQMLTAVDAHLEGREFLAREFSGADIQTGHACCVARRFGIDFSALPNLTAYTDRLMARPGLEKAWDV